MTYKRKNVQRRAGDISVDGRDILRRLQRYHMDAPKDTSGRPTGIIRTTKMMLPRAADDIFPF